MKCKSLTVYLAALLLSGLCRLPGREEFDRRQCSDSLCIFEQLPFRDRWLKTTLQVEVSVG